MRRLLGAGIGAYGAWLQAALVVAVLALLATPAAALKPITVSEDQERIEISSHPEAELYAGRGDSLRVETAAATDGSTEPIVVRAVNPGSNPTWLVFALRNPTNKPIELWLTADRYNASGSGVVWPDLDTRRISAVSHSAGFETQHVKNDRVDIYRITIDRGQTVTYVAELATERMTRMYLWKPLEFEQRQRERHLFNGIMLGVMGLMAVFLTAVFAANHKMIFPAAALVSWCVLGLLCVDFGFWHKLFQMRPEDNAQYRAAAEAAIAASLVIFLFTFLRVSLWHGFARILFVAWIVGQLAIVALAVLDPKLSATVARMSIALIGALGTLIIGFLAARRLERALALVPTWLLFLVWLFGASATLTGRLPGDAAISGLVAGLVLIMVLIGFTVTQFAFRANEPAYGISPSQRQLRLAAIEQAGVSVWEWSARRNEIRVEADIEAALGLGAGELPTRVEEIQTLLHPADRERFVLAFDTMRQNDGGHVRMDIRLRHTDSSYRCFTLEGATVPTRDRRTLRSVGVIRDVTDAKVANERLLADAVRDSLTGLPNRELLVDRIDAAIARARSDRGSATVFYIDLDRFRAINGQFGMIVGDSILLTVARRLQRGLGTHDTLARLSGDRFGLLVTSISDPRELARLAEQLRLALRSPVRIAGQEIVLTGSIGIAMFDRSQATGRDLLHDAEIAMWRAKRAGGERLEIFNADVRPEKEDRAQLGTELRQAIAGRKLTMLYQPIVALSTEELVGFEAVVRWEHPKLGRLSPTDLAVLAEDGDLASELGVHVLERAAIDIARWQKELARPDLPLFVSVDLTSRRLVKPELAQELRHIVGRAVIPPTALRLEIAEPLVMENPEQATQILELLADVGVGLCLDDVGAGYSSPAFLGRLPAETIKLDRALVQMASQDDGIAALVRSLVAMGNELGRKVAADGVETAADAAFLRAIGCATAQGFYYGEPMGEGEIERLLRLIRKADRRMRRRGLVRGQEKRKPAAQSSPAATSGDPPASPFGNGMDHAARAPNGAMPGLAAPIPAAPDMPRTGPGAQPTGNAPRPLASPITGSPPLSANPATARSTPLMAPPETPAPTASSGLQASKTAPPGSLSAGPNAGAAPPPSVVPPAFLQSTGGPPSMPPANVAGPGSPAGRPPMAGPPSGPATATSFREPAAPPVSAPATMPHGSSRPQPRPPQVAQPIVTPATGAPLRPVDAPRANGSGELQIGAGPPPMPPDRPAGQDASVRGSSPAPSPAIPAGSPTSPSLPPSPAAAAQPAPRLPPALEELQAALDQPTLPTAPGAKPTTESRATAPDRPAQPATRQSRLQRRPINTSDRNLPPSMAANLAKIAGRTAASRLVQPGSETDDRASGPPASEKRQPPKDAAE